VNLVDVEWKPALASILDMHGLQLVERIPGSGVFSVTPRQADAPEPMIVETLFLEYTVVDDVVPVVKTMLVPGATVSPFNSRNAFVLRSTSANIGEVKQILKLIDIPGQQVCIETKFMELSDEASKQLGIRWDSLEEFGVRAGLGPFQYSRSVESVNSSTDTETDWDNRNQTDTVTKYYDVDGVQYEVTEDVTVTAVEDADDIIVETITPTTEVTDTIDSGSDISSEIVDSFTETILESQSAILELDNLNIILSALKKTDGVSIISNPKLIVANGDAGAFFSVGDREPIIRTEITRGTVDSPGDKETAILDTAINTDFIKEGYLETGITLLVKPTVKSEGLIEADINPSLRRKVGTKTVAGNSWPIISVKEIKTSFTLRNMQTVAIGGLTDTQDQKVTSKVPLLGDIPLIGKYLFSHTKDAKSQDETIIFVTLSLAQPESLREQTGIPEDAELVHKKLIQRASARRQFEEDLARMRQAMEAEAADMPPEQEPVVAPPRAEATTPPAASEAAPSSDASDSAPQPQDDVPGSPVDNAVTAPAVGATDDVVPASGNETEEPVGAGDVVVE
jgi:type IV pilus assembly protein PilQ